MPVGLQILLDFKFAVQTDNVANTHFKTQKAHSKTGSMEGIIEGVRVYTQVQTTLCRHCIEIVAALSPIVTAFCKVLDKVKRPEVKMFQRQVLDEETRRYRIGALRAL